MIYNLFPTPVGHYKIERDLTRAELKFINKQEKKQNEGNKTSVDHYVLKNTKLLKLNTFLEESLKDYGILVPSGYLGHIAISAKCLDCRWTWHINQLR